MRRLILLKIWCSGGSAGCLEQVLGVTSVPIRMVQRSDGTSTTSSSVTSTSSWRHRTHASSPRPSWEHHPTDINMRSQYNDETLESLGAKQVLTSDALSVDRSAPSVTNSVNVIQMKSPSPLVESDATDTSSNRDGGPSSVPEQLHIHSWSQEDGTSVTNKDRLLKLFKPKQSFQVVSNTLTPSQISLPLSTSSGSYSEQRPQEIRRASGPLELKPGLVLKTDLQFDSPRTAMSELTPQSPDRARKELDAKAEEPVIGIALLGSILAYQYVDMHKSL